MSLHSTTAGTPAIQPAIEHLALSLRTNAEFRRAKQVEFAADKRNGEAALSSDLLADQLEGGHFSADIARRYLALYDDERTALAASEAERDCIAAIGFRWEFDDANSFLNYIVNASGPDAFMEAN